jgi:hypothetical protein
MKKRRAKFRLEDYSKVEKKYKSAFLKTPAESRKNKAKPKLRKGFLTSMLILCLFVLLLVLVISLPSEENSQKKPEYIQTINNGPESHTSKDYGIIK